MNMKKLSSISSLLHIRQQGLQHWSSSRLRDAVRRKLPKMSKWWLDDSSWQHNYHTSCLMQGFFWKTTSHQSHFVALQPDLGTCHFWLFLNFKLYLKETRLQAVDGIKENTMRQLMLVPKEDFADCFRKWTVTIQVWSPNSFKGIKS